LSTVVETTTTRPSRAEIDPAALDLVRRHGGQIMACARRYAATPEDAEDAYQRGLEILLTKAPSTHEDDLVPWLKTVVKHEAFALRKQREKHGVPTEQDELTPARTDTHEQVERLDTLQRGAEAMQRLKPQEMRCLLLLAEGYSYRQICEITGFTYTKVNRCLAEGRQSFLRRVDGIEAGDECARLAPLLSAAADGEADADDMLALRRHMRGCLACRASLREARQVPARVAAVAPAGILLAPGGADALAADRLHTIWNWIQERFAALALRGHEVVELATAHKAAAVAASAAALAGGGAATVHGVTDQDRAVTPTSLRATVAAASRPAVRAAIALPPRPRPAPAPRPAPRPAQPADPPPQTAPAPQAPPPAPQPAPAATPAPATPEPAPAPEPQPAPSGEFGP
jgi:RNA polymerase sigma factor (sigma-70 family)